MLAFAVAWARSAGTHAATAGSDMPRLWTGGIVAVPRGRPVYSCGDTFERHAAAVEAAAGPTLKTADAAGPR